MSKERKVLAFVAILALGFACCILLPTSTENSKPVTVEATSTRSVKDYIETITTINVTEPEPTDIPEPTEPEFLVRCIPVLEERIVDIQDGVDDIVANNYVVEAYAVRSNDYEKVYFMAAFIYGDGIEEGVGPGVWARVGALDEPGLIFSVGGFANGFSAWGDGGSTDATFSLFSDGAQEAIECANYFK